MKSSSTCLPGGLGAAGREGLTGGTASSMQSAQSPLLFPSMPALFIWKPGCLHATGPFDFSRAGEQGNRGLRGVEAKAGGVWCQCRAPAWSEQRPGRQDQETAAHTQLLLTGPGLAAGLLVPWLDCASFCASNLEVLHVAELGRAANAWYQPRAEQHLASALPLGQGLLSSSGLQS